MPSKQTSKKSSTAKPKSQVKPSATKNKVTKPATKISKSKRASKKAAAMIANIFSQESDTDTETLIQPQLSDSDESDDSLTMYEPRSAKASRSKKQRLSLNNAKDVLISDDDEAPEDEMDEAELFKMIDSVVATTNRRECSKLLSQLTAEFEEIFKITTRIHMSLEQSRAGNEEYKNLLAEINENMKKKAKLEEKVVANVQVLDDGAREFVNVTRNAIKARVKQVAAVQVA